MRITEKGQVTIPVEVRRKLGLNPGDEVEFVLEGNGARVVRAATVPSRGKRLVERLRGKATTTMTTDEIMALTRGDDDDC
ncbi:AbrB/MazE/SpoVT family DNA-binding domain-containing protein [Nocardiopsis exhalans]|jgi:AbrB family looped-hinge helix DNA binding protein|uniref:AbrB family looped-hinge helix DNA binding protein n=2 Tax=Nocardiopsis TaxID=2013 RepID=A0A840WAH1_9ACTN|nr:MULTISPECIES: AbrB/MazE/SpoVT family DNA-binding domain-containing protein [Nocardiopsis]MBB5493102.1 AbrB family looped-hinge helix DNA binding protein [Nocardiopsis metallicus]USY19506.1 AbrB/MazE/SpoVT family DNA-binding domain-containing protein [Nocardiopsis exhalans]